MEFIHLVLRSTGSVHHVYAPLGLMGVPSTAPTPCYVEADRNGIWSPVKVSALESEVDGC